MIGLTQVVERPFGVSVFGSALIMVEPDVASMTFAVSSLQQEPRDAFATARQAAQSVRGYLAKAGLSEVGSSRVWLAEKHHFKDNEELFIGYTAQITFHLLLHDLDRMEEILTGVVDAGASKIISVELVTTRLAELRNEARQRAVLRAREKAEAYGNAAGVTLGRVIHIEDIAPDAIQRHSSSHMAREMAREDQPDDQAVLRAINPESVRVSAAVVVVFEIQR